jgi:hypothetical protein
VALARWQATIVDSAGNIQAGASVTVRREVIGSPLASLFEDRDGLVPTGNPITADADGYAFFHVAGGAYRITASKGGFTREWRYVALGTLAEQDSAATSLGNLGVTGFIDLAEIAAPANPDANVARIYAFDDGGITRIGIKDAAGAVTAIGSGLFLPANSPISWNAGDVTIVHSANALAFAGATSGYSFDNVLSISPPAASTAKALNVSQTGPTSGSHGPAFDFNTIAIGSEQVSVSGSGTVYGLAVTHGFGGSNALGQRTAIRGLLVLNTATSASQPLGNAYSAVSGEGQMSAGDNGTNTASGAKGTMIGLYGSSIAAAGATNIHRMAGAEINTALRATASARYHVGLQITQWGDHAVSGAELDAALQIGNQVGAVGWANYGIVFDVASAGLGTLFKSTATLMGTKGAVTAAQGINFESATFTGAAFASNGFFVNGGGHVNTPRVSGGLGAASTLTLVATEGAGAGSEAIIFAYGNAGANIAGRVTGAGRILAVQPLAGIGYGTGAGGTVTQATNKTTGVTLNKVVGQITLASGALAAGARAAFTVTNSAIEANDLVIAHHVGGGTANAYEAECTSVVAGSFVLQVANVTAGSLNETPVIRFAVIKGALS